MRSSATQHGDNDVTHDDDSVAREWRTVYTRRIFARESSLVGWLPAIRTDVQRNRQRLQGHMPAPSVSPSPRIPPRRRVSTAVTSRPYSARRDCCFGVTVSEESPSRTRLNGVSQISCASCLVCDLYAPRLRGLEVGAGVHDELSCVGGQLNLYSSGFPVHCRSTSDASAKHRCSVPHDKTIFLATERAARILLFLYFFCHFCTFLGWW